MLWFILAIVLPIFIGLGCHGNLRDKLDCESEEEVGLAFFLWVILTIFVATPLQFILYFAASEHTESVSRELVAVKTDVRTSAGYTSSFFLASGYIDSVDTYVYFAKDGEGRIRHKTAWNKEAAVVECDCKPHVVYSAKINNSNNWLTIEKSFEYTSWFKTFYVPKGSILQDYNLKN